MDMLQWYERCNAFIDTHLEEFLSQFYPDSMAIPIPNGYRLNPCPFCGHNDAATFTNGQVYCFSCGESGNNVSAYVEYLTRVKNGSPTEARKNVAKFCNIEIPSFGTDEEKAERKKLERKYEIRRIAVEFYVQQLKTHDTKYQFHERQLTPMDYIKSVRGHTEDTIASFRIGFAANYLILYNLLISLGYEKEEIKDAGAYMPEGVFVHPQWHPVTKDLLRINTKNPFGAKMNFDGKEVEIVGYSSKNSEKTCGFAPNFSFKQPIILVEGEDDAESVYEKGGKAGKNVAWLSGNFNDSQMRIFKKATKPIYLMMDNDHQGEHYIERINAELPDKMIYVIEYDKNDGDPDDYFKGKDPLSVEELMAKAQPLETKAFATSKDNDTWTIANRHKSLVFIMRQIDERKGTIAGDAKLFKNGEPVDGKNNAVLTTLPQSFKPMSILLSEEIDKHYSEAREKLYELSWKEMLEMYRFSKYKAEIIKAFANKAHKSKDPLEQTIVRLRESIGQDAVDEVLKEINDIQNRGVLDKIVTIPTLKLSHFFSIKNNDAYFYFTAVKYDGDTIRRIPYLLRNDGEMIRLDLYKRKDSQCLLLIDNKYELPEEVNEAKMELEECSLMADWAESYSEGNVKPEDICPDTIIREIETYIRKFYYSADDNLYKVVALYVYGTYFYEMFGQYPYLFLNGQKGSGKTILDIVIYMFALNAKLAVNISEAALYRIVALEGGTMILDEIENLTSRTKSQDSLMATLLKGGYQKGGKAYRYNRDLNKSEGFEVFSPKVISNIFGVEDVIEDRCIRIDTQRMKVQKGFKLEDPKYYHKEKLNEIRDVTSKAALSALKHFQALNHIYNNSHMVTNNARLTQLLTTVLALARFVDTSKTDVGLKDNYKKIDAEKLDGEYTKAFLEYYESKIVVVKDEIEANTPEGVIKSIVNQVAHELSGFIAEKDLSYTDSLKHKYVNAIKYTEDTGEFVLDALHMKTFMEETLSDYKISLAEVHQHMKKVFNLDNTKRRDVHLLNSPDVSNEFNGNKKLKVQHYEFNVKDFVKGANSFLQPTNSVSTKSVGGVF